MCCFNKVNLCAILLVHKRIINKDCTVKINNIINVYNNIYNNNNISVGKGTRSGLHKAGGRVYRW